MGAEEEGQVPSHAPDGGASIQALIENRTYDELEVGDAVLERTLLPGGHRAVRGDVGRNVNPAHVDEEYARTGLFHELVGHGMWGASLISTVLGTRLPGPGAIYLEQTLSFRRPVTIGDALTVSVTVAAKEPKHRVTLECRCINQRGEAVIEGVAKVLAPTEKVRRPRFELPDVILREHGRGPSAHGHA